MNDQAKVMEVKAGDLPKLCVMDEAEIIKPGLVRESGKAGKTVVALIPDKETLQWHHAREEFFAKDQFGRDPEPKGAYIHGADGTRSWCVWTRMFGDMASRDTFMILRLAIEGDRNLQSVESETFESDPTNAPSDEKLEEVASLLRAAQNEASKWAIKEVQLWNPTRLALLAAKKIDPSIRIVHREEDSITSLRWHGSEEHVDVDWLGNEKCGWC